MKKLMSAGAALALAICLAACGGPQSSDNPASGSAAPGGASDFTLTFESNVVGTQSDALAQVVKDFTAETGIKVDFIAPGADYETLMATKMAANDMPDLFTTHGWSVLRYSSFLEPVNDQPFFSKIGSQIKPVITDADGKVYVLPVDADIAGIVYNVDVLQAAGVDPDSLTTWAKFSEALGKIKDAGVTPLYAGGKDTWTVGQFGDWLAPSFFITNEADNQREALTSGTFDKATWEKLATLMADWTGKDYFNTDALTADYLGASTAMAEGKSAFGFYGNSFMVDVHAINPDTKLGMMPIPAEVDSDTPSLIAGERLAVGVWKDSAHKDAAFQLLNYLAKPENVKVMAEAGGSPAGLTDATVELGDVQTYLDKYSDIRTFPYFDRAYLPNGMWDVMCATNADILGKKADAVTQAGDVMESNFKDKYVG